VQPEPGAIAAAIERVLGDPALASSLAERGRALVERHRNRDHEIERLIGLYRRLAG
jgi:glycosyltransferase involved in cell wall biosynthesis